MFTPNEMMLIFVVIVCVWAVMLFFIERLQQRFFEQELDALSDDQKTLSSESRSEALLMSTKTPEDALIELLDRVTALQGASALFNDEELTQWPGKAVAAMKAQKLITKARPATSAVCTECERECVMPVHVLAQSTGPAAFIFCDKRNDIDRAPVPITRLEQWQVSGDSIADLLAGLLDLQHSGVGNSSDERWEIGVFKGSKHSSHLVLLAGEKLTLTLAGHSIALDEVLAIDGNTFKMDKRRLTRLVDQPVESAKSVMVCITHL